MRIGWWALVVAVLALATSASPASAAFPGADGQLVLTPAHGGGILIASPHTGAARRVCDAPQRCGTRPADARFSPTGRELVFRDGNGRLEVSTVTGACVWCETSHPQWNLPGASPAFTADGATVTYVRSGGLWAVTPGSSRATRLRMVAVSVSAGPTPVTAAAWSASGRVAVIRGGWLWTGVRKLNSIILVRRLARGAAPVWSPDGRELAFTRNGFVLTIRTTGHHPTRIARGTSPAFSPDGRALAYLNPRHQVTIRPLGHSRTRTLSRLRGRSLDWQPVTAITRRGCAAGNGVVVARNATATIRAAANAKRTHMVWNGCLTALGVPFHLTGGLIGEFLTLALRKTALAGNYAALEFISDDKGQDFTDTIDVYDLRNGSLVRSEPVPCQQPQMPCRVSSLAVNASGFVAWHAVQTSQPAENGFTAISCPTVGLCVAGDTAGDILVSTAPSGGRPAWARDSVSPGPGAIAIVDISCPTTALCVAVGLNGTVSSSTDPTGGVTAWHSVYLGSVVLDAVSCASASLCVAVGGQTVYTTTDPTGPASAWTPHTLSSSPTLLQTVSCASSTLCVIGDSAGDLLVSTDPSDPAPSWTTDHTSGYVSDVDCPTTGLCVAITNANPGTAVLSTTDPAANTWTTTHLGVAVASVTCAGTSLCLATGGSAIATTTDPADASPSWTETTLAEQLHVASCPAAGLCVGTDGASILTSSNPTGGASAWNASLVDVLDCYPCLSETLTAVDDHGAHTLDTAPPGPGTHIANLQLTGDTLRWTHDGAPRSAGLS